ncbi:hypothetical protein TIFTF001_002550 [Ficus carica]|uniref:Uncharacterized protein n=1 Tax=Ficus carica TaxID=3494 RepID=A0AA88CSF0_FICCA|nr:hypothetical protein TIFTF001_002550 [Ficus carica]
MKIIEEKREKQCQLARESNSIKMMMENGSAEEAKSLRKLNIEKKKTMSGISGSSYTTSSLESAARKACISPEKYVASRQEFLRTYHLTTTTTTAGKKKESVGNRTKKWFKDNKPKNRLRFIVLCMAAKLDVHD